VEALPGESVFTQVSLFELIHYSIVFILKAKRRSQILL